MSTKIAFDGNRVGHRTQRGFHATWYEMNGLPVWLTPATAQEIAGRVSLWDIEGSVKALDDEGKEREFLMAGLAASWPDERTAPVDAVVRTFRERRARMAGARLEMTGERLLNLAHGERDLATCIEETRARLPEKTRAAETRERRYRAAAATGGLRREPSSSGRP